MGAEEEEDDDYDDDDDDDDDDDGGPPVGFGRRLRPPAAAAAARANGAGTRESVFRSSSGAARTAATARPRDGGRDHARAIAGEGSGGGGGGGGGGGSKGGRESVFRTAPPVRSAAALATADGVIPFRGRRSLARSTSSEERDIRISESNAHQILLSLSKSFERGAVGDEGDGPTTVTTAARRRGAIGAGGTAAAGRGGRGDAAATREEGGGGTATTTRPKSPDEPPRIQHWHKLRSNDTFEASVLSRARAGGQRHSILNRMSTELFILIVTIYISFVLTVSFVPPISVPLPSPLLALPAAESSEAIPLSRCRRGRRGRRWRQRRRRR
jgi:hypothetical protein